MRCMPILIVLSLMTWVVTEATDVCGTHADGCSIPFGLDFFYKELFTHSCNRHDVCYGCGAMYGVSRDDCDNAFLADMTTACNSRSRRGLARADKRSVCTTTARDVYYYAVHVFAGSHFFSADSPEFYCSQAWVRSCLPRM